ncbi:MAG: hypothetical protein LH679_01995 [Cyanobacteria bacterium CAN_BIN43]|nr:hypothetical protein [Cyanobacteria bacterium CAN_BIN43]
MSVISLCQYTSLLQYRTLDRLSAAYAFWMIRLERDRCLTRFTFVGAIDFLEERYAKLTVIMARLHNGH